MEWTDQFRPAATPDGHDPSTCRFEVCRSIQLSYGVPSNLRGYSRVTPDGHDPSTSCFVGRRSIQLSYGAIG